MTDDEIISLANKILTPNTGVDYEVYDHCPHWWGDRKEIIAFARALKSTQPQDPS